MHIWQLQHAKAKLTQLIKDAKEEPQIISRHGIKETIVMSIEHYQALMGKKETLADFFQRSPLFGLEMEFQRDKSCDRDVDFLAEQDEG